MDWLGPVTGITGSTVAIGGLIFTIWKARKDAALGITAAEVEDRGLTFNAYDRLIDQLQEERDRRTEEIKEERAERITQVAALEAKFAELEQQLQAERTYSGLLLAHIWAGKPPPPPERPGTPPATS